MQLSAYTLIRYNMSLKYAILSMTIQNPKSGYDIAKEFTNSVNFYWEASHQQIYKTLSELEGKQWLRVKVIEQTGKPDKKNYSITATGRKALQEWVEQPTKMPQRKNILLIKLLALEEVGAAVLIKQLQQYQQSTEQQLSAYRDIENEYFPNGIESTQSDSSVSKYFALRKGIHFANGELLWLKETVASLEQRK
ncbi:MAG: DNA-binding PadR family transcriptional regulator [Candidatus Endobugula sp.]|jgi:DNA-binding PadR family transcriptional regulator